MEAVSSLLNFLGIVWTDRGFLWMRMTSPVDRLWASWGEALGARPARAGGWGQDVPTTLTSTMAMDFAWRWIGTL